MRQNEIIRGFERDFDRHLEAVESLTSPAAGSKFPELSDLVFHYLQQCLRYATGIDEILPKFAKLQIQLVLRLQIKLIAFVKRCKPPASAPRCFAAWSLRCFAVLLFLRLVASLFCCFFASLLCCLFASPPRRLVVLLFLQPGVERQVRELAG